MTVLVKHESRITMVRVRVRVIRGAFRKGLREEVETYII